MQQSLGTQLNIKKKLFQRKIHVLTVLLAPVLTFGVALISYQTYHILAGNGFQHLDFNIGSLWSSDKGKKINYQPQNSSSFALQEKMKNASADPITVPLFTKEFNNERKQKFGFKSINEGQNTSSLNNQIISQIFNTNLDMKIVELPKSIVSLKYVKQVNQPYLFQLDVEKTPSRWSLGVNFSPTISYRYLNYQNKGVSFKEIGNTRYISGLTEGFKEKSDKKILAFNVGITLGYQLHKNWVLYGGVRYARQGEQVALSNFPEQDPENLNHQLYAKSPSYCSGESVNSVNTFYFKNQFDYFEFPLLLAYQTAERKNGKIELSLGIIPKVLDHANAMVYDFDSDYYYWLPNADYPIYRKWNVASSIGISVSQYLSPSFEVFAKPEFNLDLISAFTDEYIMQQKQYNLGINLGIRKHILIK